jgi:hypothetical protein
MAGAKNDVMFNFGVSFLFGGTKDQAAVVVLPAHRNYKDD